MTIPDAVEAEVGAVRMENVAVVVRVVMTESVESVSVIVARASYELRGWVLCSVTMEIVTGDETVTTLDPMVDG